MAILYGKIANFSVLLCSATPSLESFSNASSGKYQYFHLTQTFGSGNEINFIDLSQEKTAKKNIITQKLQQEIAKNLANKQQTLLFLNKSYCLTISNLQTVQSFRRRPQPRPRIHPNIQHPRYVVSRNVNME